MKKETAPKEYLSPKEAAKVLGMSVANLLKTAKQNHGIPFYMLNARVIRFERHDIDAFMERRRIEMVMY